MTEGDNAAMWRLKVVTETDPGALVRVLQVFQSRNVVPRRALAWRLDIELLTLEIDIDAADCPQEAFRLTVAKVNEIPIVLSAVASVS